VTKGTGFDVHVEYDDKSTEHVDVTAPTYNRALSEGLEQRRQIRVPVAVKMRRR